MSRYHEVVLHQGRIERCFLDSLKAWSVVKVERGVIPDELEMDHSKVEDAHAHPINVRLRHLHGNEVMPAQKLTNNPDRLFRSSLAKDDTDDLIRQNHSKHGTSELVRAKYMIGSDGAHSWTRRQLGFVMEGEQTEFIWVILDIIPITDFRML